MTTTLAPINDPDAVRLGYYVCVAATRHLDVGIYVRVTRVTLATAAGDASVHYQYRDHGYTQDRTSFLVHFVWAPDGEARFNTQLQALMAEIGHISAEATDLQHTLANVTAYALPGTREAAGLDTLAAIVPLADRTPAGYKRALAQVRKIAGDKQELLRTKQAELQAMLAEQLAIAEAALKPLQEMVDAIQEGIWTLNLYLGRDEEIVRLRSGQPAPIDTPITLRQLVLAMDQESAVAAEVGGIDAMDIPTFDRWIVECPEHLDQILPEVKGVVVLVPRWDPKVYNDVEMTRRVANANKQSYFLIRNGDNLYRIATDFIVGKTLVPTRDQFINLFWQRRYDHRTREYVREPLVPGSREYMDAEKQAGALDRHYLRVGLILQGLIDRSTVFHPLPGPVQITRAEAYEQGLVQIIADGEFALGDGREPFLDWLTRLNGNLDVGMRVVGNFHGWSNDGYSFAGLRDSGRHERLSPPRAEPPASHTLYRLEGRRADGLYFLYHRNEEIWSRDDWELREPRMRASCVVKPTDRFILAFDAADMQDMEYYLHSRLHRHAYVSMFPLLKAAIRLKRQEDAEEAPFRQLLAGEIMKRYTVDGEDAHATVPNLVRWYKFKTRYHRPLLEDDHKALRMIVDEYGIRQREAANRAQRHARGEAQQIVQAALKDYPNALLIAHKREREYVVLVPENDDDVFVTERVCTPEREIERKPWRLVDKRWERWNILYTSERWKHWPRSERWSDHITGPEVEALAAAVQDILPSAIRDLLKRYPNRVGANVPLVITFDPDDKVFRAYLRREDAVIPDGALWGATKKDVQVGSLRWCWQRNVRREAVLRAHPTWEDVHWDWDGDALPWDAGVWRRDSSNGWHGTRSKRTRAETIIWHDDTQIAMTMRQHAQFQIMQQRVHDLEHRVGTAYVALRKQWHAREEGTRYLEFLQEYGDVQLWEGHLKTLPALRYPHDRTSATGDALRAVLAYVLEHGGTTTTMLFRDVAAAAIDRGWQRPDAFPQDLDDLEVAPLLPAVGENDNMEEEMPCEQR